MYHVRCPNCNRESDTAKAVFQCRKCGKRSRTVDFIIQDMVQTPTQLPPPIETINHEVIVGHLIYN